MYATNNELVVLVADAEPFAARLQAGRPPRSAISRVIFGIGLGSVGLESWIRDFPRCADTAQVAFRSENPQRLGNCGGRNWDRTSDPCDVNAGPIAQPIDLADAGRVADLRLRH